MIEKIRLGADTWTTTKSSWKPVSEELVKEALELILDESLYPLLLVCTSGVHQTGTVIACLRKLQHWTMMSILMELRRSPRAKYAAEQFVELFDLDLVTLPRTAARPAWFNEQEEMWRADVAEAQRRRRLKLNSNGEEEEEEEDEKEKDEEKEEEEEEEEEEKETTED